MHTFRFLPAIVALLGAGLAFTAFANSREDAREELEAGIRLEEIDLGRFFAGLEGTFVLLDPQQATVWVHNPTRAGQGFIPASTFKICNALIALETGVATGVDFSLPWDRGVAPPLDWWPRNWRRDQTLQSAFQNSVYWFYQEVARRIGEQKMRSYLQQFEYGNQNIGGGIDQFWLTGDLRISAYEQVSFLQRLYSGDLGLSERTLRIVRALMLLEEGSGYTLSGKTGTAMLTPTRELGWHVGFLERGKEVEFFALNMEGELVWEEWPPHKRTELVQEILVDLEVIRSAVR